MSEYKTITNDNWNSTVSWTVNTGTWCYKCSTYFWGYHNCPCYTICTCNSTIYKYQITCPKCSNKQWGEIGEKIKCSSCHKVILVKESSKKDYDYEVEVT